eukprot:4051728-Alexandrium_andersonii.AAC.1
MSEAEHAALVAGLRTEERPVATRFWAFEGCAHTLFTWKLLQPPAAELLQTGARKRREANYKRIARARRFLDGPNTRFELA